MERIEWVERADVGRRGGGEATKTKLDGENERACGTWGQRVRLKSKL